MISAITLLIVGLLLLLFGGDFLIKSAISFAKKLNVPTFLIGITVVSFGTSAPELMVSIQAALENASGITIGNVIGSNIANIGLVLGLTVIIKPISINEGKYLFSWLFMLLSSLILLFLVYDKILYFSEGLVLTGTLVTFIILSIKYIKGDNADVKTEKEKSVFSSFIYFTIACVGLYYGSELFVDNAIFIAKSVGVSEFVIGITIVAFGTSLPEMVTSLIAALKGQNSISIGNLIGSNIFNILAVLGITTLIQPLITGDNISQIFESIFVMILYTLIMGLFLVKKKISRKFGLILFSGYIIYIVFYLA